MSLRLHLISPETFVTLYQNYEAVINVSLPEL